MKKDNEIIIKLSENEYEFLLVMIDGFSKRTFTEGTSFLNWEKQLIDKIFKFENKDDIELSYDTQKIHEKVKRKVDARNILLDD